MRTRRHRSIKWAEHYESLREIVEKIKELENEHE